MIKRIKEILLELLYPRAVVCWLCGRETAPEKGLCAECAAALHTPELSADETLPHHAPFVYAEVRGAIQRFKYGGELWLSEAFAEHMEIPKAWQADVLTPVPLHPRKLRKRGYNQSMVLCESLHKRCALPLCDCLERIVDTPSQTALTPRERAANMRGAFAATAEVQGKRIILVDDVYTTGSTLRSCARTLRKAGAAQVFALTVAAADGRHEDE